MSRGPNQDSVVRQAGRGVVYIALAKAYFMVAGALIEFRLPVILTRTVFGAYAVVAATVSPFNNVLVTGTIQTMSRFTAQNPERARAMQAAGFRMHLYIGLGVSLAFVAAAPLVARFIYHDPGKSAPIMLVGGIMALYSFYSVMVGVANGRREFHKQAALDICFATLRAAGILGLASAGLGLFGALSGWVGAALLIVVIASFVVGLPGRGGERASIRPLAGFFCGVAIYLVLVNLIMFVDQILLKSLANEWFVATADTAEVTLARVLPEWVRDLVAGKLSAAKATDAQVGFYRAVQNLARLSYQAIIAATFVVFPLVSKTTFDNDERTTQRYITATLRYVLIFSTAIAVVFAANPKPLLNIPYANDFAEIGAPALTFLALGNVAFSLFVIAGTILNGAGKTRDAIVSALVTLFCAALANAVVIPLFPPGKTLLMACACATAGAMVVGALISGLFLRQQFSAFIPFLTVVRVAFCAALAMVIAQLIPFVSPLMTLVEAVVVSVVFFAGLMSTRELTGTDLRAVLAVLRKEKG